MVTVLFHGRRVLPLRRRNFLVGHLHHNHLCTFDNLKSQYRPKHVVVSASNTQVPTTALVKVTFILFTVISGSVTIFYYFKLTMHVLDVLLGKSESNWELIKIIGLSSFKYVLPVFCFQMKIGEDDKSWTNLTSFACPICYNPFQNIPNDRSSSAQ